MDELLKLGIVLGLTLALFNFITVGLIVTLWARWYLRRLHAEGAAMIWERYQQAMDAEAGIHHGPDTSFIDDAIL